MKTILTSVFVVLTAVPAALAAEPSLLSGFKGKYKGDVDYGGFFAGPASGNVKASQTKENGVIKLSSRISSQIGAAGLLEKFSLRNKRFRYQFRISTTDFTLSGRGSGRVKISRNSILLKGTANLGGQQLFQLRATVRKDDRRENLEVINNFKGMNGILIVYDLEK